MPKNCCHICGHPIVLRPSAAERARRYGGVPVDYLSLFTAHGECVVRARADEATALMVRLNSEAHA